MTTITLKANIQTGTRTVRSPMGAYEQPVYAAVTYQMDDSGSLTVISQQANPDTVPAQDSPYLQLADQPAAAPTAAQIEALAKCWLGDRSRIAHPLGHSTCTWAFAGLTPEEISHRYGTGAKVHLA